MNQDNGSVVTKENLIEQINDYNSSCPYDIFKIKDESIAAINGNDWEQALKSIINSVALLDFRHEQNRKIFSANEHTRNFFIPYHQMMQALITKCFAEVSLENTNQEDILKIIIIMVYSNRDVIQRAVKVDLNFQRADLFTNHSNLHSIITNLIDKAIAKQQSVLILSIYTFLLEKSPYFANNAQKYLYLAENKVFDKLSALQKNANFMNNKDKEIFLSLLTSITDIIRSNDLNNNQSLINRDDLLDLFESLRCTIEDIVSGEMLDLHSDQDNSPEWEILEQHEPSDSSGQLAYLENLNHNHVINSVKIYDINAGDASFMIEEELIEQILKDVDDQSITSSASINDGYTGINLHNNDEIFFKSEFNFVKIEKSSLLDNSLPPMQEKVVTQATPKKGNMLMRGLHNVGNMFAKLSGLRGSNENDVIERPKVNFDHFVRKNKNHLVAEKPDEDRILTQCTDSKKNKPDEEKKEENSNSFKM